MIILQIAPVIGVGTGVGTVAYHLEQEWSRMGHDVRRLELRDTGASWLPEPGPGVRGKLALMARVVWFSTVGTVAASRRVKALPTGAVSICHNDALAGDIYVNHGILQTSLAARGHPRLRTLRNPLHVFITVRDRLRYHSRVHKVVVNLTSADERELRRVYPGLRPDSWVIGNGVDVVSFSPPTAVERAQARAELGLTANHLATVFVGHEYGRKGLFPLLEAISKCGPRHHLVVVGGDSAMVGDLRRRATELKCADRCRLMGAADPRPALAAGDILAQPSAYESYGLVVAEALASGVPVLSTPVGIAPDVIVEGRTGYLTNGTPEDLVARLRQFEDADRETMRSEARQAAESLAWTVVARSYLCLLETLTQRSAEPSSGR